MLEIIKNCVRFDRFIISLGKNRKENQQFIDEYNLTTNKQKQIMLNLNIDDFCYATRDIKNHNDILYVFAPIVLLKDIENVSIRITMYIKNKIIKDDGINNLVIISFHALNNYIEYAFK